MGDFLRSYGVMIEVHPREIEIDVVSLNGSYSVDAFFQSKQWKGEGLFQSVKDRASIVAALKKLKMLKKLVKHRLAWVAGKDRRLTDTPEDKYKCGAVWNMAIQTTLVIVI